MWLDGPWFPFILDTITGHADPDTQRTLRQTCRRIRGVVDRELFKHAMIRSPTDQGFAVSARYIRAGLPLCRIASDEDWTDPYDDADTAAVLALLAPTKILDVYGHMPPAFRHWFASINPRRHFGSLWEPYTAHYTGRKLVVFRHLSSQDDVRPRWLHMALGPSLRTLVVNIIFEQQLDPRILLAAGGEVPNLGDIDELVVVLAPQGRRCPFPRAKPTEYGAFFNIYHLVAQYTDHSLKSTIVGMESIDCRWLGSSSPLDSAEIVQSARKIINNLANHYFEKEKGFPMLPMEAFQFNSLLTFMTLNEYRAAVGEDEFAVNTVA
ncbi:uncharacterized protein LOC62_05G006822 [Vanrija pseudolonga]|uniref:F-box domain-containing protein n=1 Tax=Vanrija pseudolonga TaxID=143232 RepID=A0AAF1BSC8_9TREE|nr:hypothetical protein LOC62_05G006822 [Vanrija pseudolonga]